MLRVTIELLPGGREASARVLSVAHIWNKGQEPGESPNRRKTILSDSVLKPRNHHPNSDELGGV